MSIEDVCKRWEEPIERMYADKPPQPVKVLKPNPKNRRRTRGRPRNEEYDECVHSITNYTRHGGNGHQ